MSFRAFCFQTHSHNPLQLCIQYTALNKISEQKIIPTRIFSQSRTKQETDRGWRWKKKDAPTQPGNLQVTDSQTNTYLLELQLQITFTRNLKFLFLIHPRQY